MNAIKLPNRNRIVRYSELENLISTDQSTCRCNKRTKGKIWEELWIYSKSVELLTEPEDACYLAAQTQDIQLNITEMLCLLKNKLPVKDVDWLIEICDNVFSGEKFDDIMFNNVIEHFIQKKIEQ